MANNITNRLTVQGKPEDVQRFFTAIYGGMDENEKPLLIDFNKIKPMPESLDIECSTVTERALDYYVIKLSAQSGTAAIRARLGDYAGEVFKRLPQTMSRQMEGRDVDDMPELLKLGEQCYNNILAHGAPTWYEWSMKNWNGTKWNAYKQERVDENTLTFQTAFCGVPKLLQELSAQQPEVKMSYIFASDDRGRDTGMYEFESGECVFEYKPPNHSPDAEEIVEKLLGQPENEDDEDWEDEM